MKLTKFQRHILRRLAAGDKLYTDTRRRYATVHRADHNQTGARRVPFRTLEALQAVGAVEVVRDFHKRGEYSRHWFDLTDAGREEVTSCT
jgi:hypothetical protein